MNCNASTQTINGHTYSTPLINHGASSAITSAQVSVATVCAGNYVTYNQTFSCFNGAISTSGGETTNSTVCWANFHLTTSTCTANTRNTSCGSQPANSTNNSASSLTTFGQSYVCGGSWTPSKTWTYSASGWSECNFTCQAGYTWDGSTCAPNSCTLPAGLWWGTIAHNGSVTAYAASSVNCGSLCASQTRTCTLGVLSGTYTNASCVPLICPTCSSTAGACAPWTPSADNGVTACNGTRSWSCTNGGSTIWCSKPTATCSDCTLPAGLWWGTLAHNGSVTAWNYSSLACNSASSCASQTRTCTNGVISGSYANSSCSKPACACYSDGGCSGWDACNTPTCVSPGTPSAYCTLTNNPINGWWTAFGAFWACSGWWQYQYRTCTNPTPSCSWATCSGSNSNAQACCATVGQSCNDGNSCTTWETIQSGTCACGGWTNNPVAGGWSAWSSYSICSGWFRTRTRTCNNPAPSCWWAACVWSTSETIACVPFCGHCTEEMTYEWHPCYPYGSSYNCGPGNESFCSGSPCDDGDDCTSGDALYWDNTSCAIVCRWEGDTTPIGTWEYLTPEWQEKYTSPWWYDVINSQRCVVTTPSACTTRNKCVQSGIYYNDGDILNIGVSWCPCPIEDQWTCILPGQNWRRCANGYEDYPTSNCYNNIMDLNICYGWVNGI